MRDPIAIIAPAIDMAAIEKQITAEVIALQDGERKEASWSETNARRRVSIGQKLAQLKKAVTHGTWLPRLERMGIDPRNAQNWMGLAGHVSKNETVSFLAESPSLPAPTFRDAGIDKRPRKSEIAPGSELP